MKFDDCNMNLLNEYIKKYGIEGLLPQNLSQQLLQMIIEEFSNLINEDIAKMDENISMILNCVFHLLKAKMNSLPIDSIKEISLDTLYDSVHAYGLSITMEELRREKLIVIDNVSLPTLNNILNINRELIIKGD